MGAEELEKVDSSRLRLTEHAYVGCACAVVVHGQQYIIVGTTRERAAALCEVFSGVTMDMEQTYDVAVCGMKGKR